MLCDKSDIGDGMTRELVGAIGAVRETRPLVHCITNYVTVNDCANALLAVGGAPVMTDDIAEVAEIASIANALVINIGTLNERTIRSMQEACGAAMKKGIPLVLDPVGVGASRLRTGTARSLIADYRFSVIRGNASEIRALVGEGTTRGVDACEADSADSALAQTATTAALLAGTTGAVVAVTGVTDLVTDGKQTLAIGNGHPLMACITGSGCMLSAVIGAFAGALPDRLPVAVAAAICVMGLAGERAAKGERTGDVVRATRDEIGVSGRHEVETVGTGSFRVSLIDGLSLIDGEALKRGMKIARYP